MERTEKKQVLFEQVEILDASSEGHSVARHEGKVVFVENAVPGDVADIRVWKNKKKYAEGKAVHFHAYSEKREEPFCSHFGVCGGCKWQNMKYDWQLHYKQKQVEDAFQRIGHLEFPAVLPILASPLQKFYRNKLEYTFSNKRWKLASEIDTEPNDLSDNALGFHIPKRFDKILDINTCFLQAEPSDSIRNCVKEFALNNKMSFFDIRNHTGELRNLIIRTNTSGETMVIVVFFDDEPVKRTQLLNHVIEKFPALNSLLYCINQKGNDTISDQKIISYLGEGFISEIIDGIRFRIAPKSFFQTNTEQTKSMYALIKKWADLQGNELVYDLYTGTGTIANYIARGAKKVIGIDYIADAIEDAKENSRINEIANTLFFSGDIKDTLTSSFFDLHGTPDVIITDPPRAGMHEDVVKLISSSGAEKIIYVSCNPATQARDLEIMSSHYIIKIVQPLDMFPQTSHVENMTLLIRK